VVDAEYARVSNGDLTCASHSAAPDLVEFEVTFVRRPGERWPDAERDRITAESFEPGNTISSVTRRNGVSLGLLHYWRRHIRASGRVEELRFVPVTVGADSEVRPGGSELEIDIGGARVHVRGIVDGAQLRS
jgi:transposase